MVFLLHNCGQITKDYIEILTLASMKSIIKEFRKVFVSLGLIFIGSTPALILFWFLISETYADYNAVNNYLYNIDNLNLINNLNIKNNITTSTKTSTRVININQNLISNLNIYYDFNTIYNPNL